MKKDQDYIARLEHAISEKYGKSTIENPKGTWTKEKEEEYILQLKEMADKLEAEEEKSEKVDVGGFLVSKKLLNKAKRKNCKTCNKYFFRNTDDIYMSKHGLCQKCYLNQEDTTALKAYKESNNEKE